MSIKELTNSRYPNPLDGSKRIRFELPTGEGAPSKNEGVGGVFFIGSGEEFPSGFGQCPRYYIHALAWFGEANEPRRARPNLIWYNVLDHMI
ncbi:hypothetical protein CN980_03140 [Bacillus cereus]|uniref:Uncharacterized protein n=1 Tax=Bacillus cereus TaxID=1396 RepID=A0A9X7CF53_BACCE|nr:hypothetical protein CN980_03140 [Bacillus cereus]